MTELDQFWSAMIKQATEKAVDSGRHDIVQYLHLRAVNDAIRSEGVKWLFDSIIEIASSANRNNAAIEIETREPHSFTRGNSNMVGSLVNLRQGVRCLTVEAGWTRTPADGIMRGAMLAAARISHFGISRSNADLSLAYSGELPIWHIDQVDDRRRPLRLVDLNEHFLTFLDR
ncbi:MAG: hypothetical protein ABJA02_00265 [Acidobacteriota bacterium]